MVRRAATARGRARTGTFSLEGLRLHERALRAGWTVETAVAGDSFVANPSPRASALLQALQETGCRLVPVPDAVIAELTGGRDLGAIIGLVRLPPPPDLTAIVGGERECLLLLAADVKDPGNTGALLRTALAGGAAAFLASGICDPYHPKAVRTSMGSLFKLPVLRFAGTEEALAALAALDVQRVGLAVDGATTLPDLPLTRRKVAVVVGSEAQGLEPRAAEALDCLVSIPMRAALDSFSVNAAAAIALYDLGQRLAIK